MKFRAYVKTGLRKLGYDVHRIRASDAKRVGRDPFRDFVRLTRRGVRPIVFDVGANVGQSVASFRKCFAAPIIHAFEPSRGIFQVLRSRTDGITNLYLNNVALGSRREKRLLIENDHSDMSSFLEPGKDCWGVITGCEEIDVETIDSYCGLAGVTHIDILKSDTQGFDFEVMKGALCMLEQHRIHLIFTEIILSDMYEGLPRLDEVFQFLSEKGFCLVAFYEMHYQNDRASWTDALFVDSQYRSVSDNSGVA